MITRSTLRASVQARLSEPATGGLYPASQIDAALNAALDQIAAQFQIQNIGQLAIIAGATTAPFPVPGATVRDLFLPNGELVQRAHLDDARPINAYSRIRWVPFAGELLFNRPVQDREAGNWVCHYLTPPSAPAGDSTAWEIPDAIAPAIVASAAASLIRSRMIADGRRGHRLEPSLRQLAQELTTEAREIVRQNKRIARGSSLV